MTLSGTAEPPITMFGSETPAKVARSDTASVELGVEFSSSAAGEIVGLRFYKSRENTGKHTGTVWTSRGERLGALTFSDETPSGWQTARFGTPIDVKAGATYVASYHTDVGRYAADEWYFADGRTRSVSPLTASGSRYRYGKVSRFPTESHHGSNYYVDVLFSSSAARATPPSAQRRRLKQPQQRGPTTTRDFPTPATAGVPAGWTPRQTFGDGYTVSTPGAVLEDVRVNGDLTIAAENVTVRRVEVLGGYVNNEIGQPRCRNGLVLEDVSVGPAPGTVADEDHWGIGVGGFTARRVKVTGYSDGFRVGGKSVGCGPVVIEDSFVKAWDGGNCVWHADGLQGYDGPALTLRNTVLDSSEATCGTAPFFYPHSQGNTSAAIDRLLVIGGGYSFRNGMPSTVSGLKIANRAWDFGPIDVKCSAMQTWDAQIVTVDANYRTTPVRTQRCNTEAGG